MQWSDIDSGFGLLGLTIKNAVVGAVASFVALRFFDGHDPWERWSTFLGGWALAAWGGPPLASWLELSQKVEIGIVLLIGLFGMAVASQAIRLVRDTDWKGLVDTYLRKKGGGS